MLRLFPYRIEFHRSAAIERRSGYRVAAHVHADHEFILVHSGSYRSMLNGEKLTLRRGTLLAVLPGDRHADDAPGRVRLLTANCSASPGSSQGRSADLLRPGLPVAARILPACQGLAPLFSRIIAEDHRCDALAPMLLDALCLELICELLRRAGPERISPALQVEAGDHRFRQDLYACFESHLGHQPSLGDLATGMQMGRSALNQRCHAVLDASPVRLFQRFAMDRARVLVERSDLPLRAISAQLGFANPFHLSVVYKRIHGVPPSAHRS